MPQKTLEYTLDQADQYIRDHINAMRRECYARHPERVLRNRLTRAVNLLTRQGLIDDQTRADLIQRVGGVGR